ILLLIKVALVLFVILLGGILRYAMKRKRENSIGRLLKVDISLMVIILGITGVFTQISPLPQNEPLEWHKQGETIEFTTSILPKAPG
ncbi:CopD family protein, partial [Pseudomonas syringae group genomosp. 7]|uniref:CopD family protein n=1 Tax=Pseudomonas syringae group genomosp. 7 TaxID=251699 RepID=UPI00376FBEF0